MNAPAPGAHTSSLASLENIAISQARMEGKLDQALLEHDRRVTQVEVRQTAQATDITALRELGTKNSERISATEQRITSLENDNHAERGERSNDRRSLPGRVSSIVSPVIAILAIGASVLIALFS